MHFEMTGQFLALVGLWWLRCFRLGLKSILKENFTPSATKQTALRRSGTPETSTQFLKWNGYRQRESATERDLPTSVHSNCLMELSFLVTQLKNSSVHPWKLASGSSNKKSDLKAGQLSEGWKMTLRRLYLDSV